MIKKYILLLVILSSGELPVIAGGSLQFKKPILGQHNIKYLGYMVGMVGIAAFVYDWKMKQNKITALQQQLGSIQAPLQPPLSRTPSGNLKVARPEILSRTKSSAELKKSTLEKFKNSLELNSSDNQPIILPLMRAAYEFDISEINKLKDSERIKNQPNLQRFCDELIHLINDTKSGLDRINRDKAILTTEMQQRMIDEEKLTEHAYNTIAQKIALQFIPHVTSIRF